MCIYGSNNFDLLFFIENKRVNGHFAMPMVANYVATRSIKIEPAAINLHQTPMEHTFCWF